MPSSSSLLASLHHLTKAPNKACVLKAFNRIYMTRDNTCSPSPSSSSAKQHHHLPVLMQEMSLQEDEAKEVYQAILHIIQLALYANEVDEVEKALLQDGLDLDSRLVALIKQIITVQLPEWREASILQRPSLPKLIDMDWRIDLKASSQQMKRLPAIPSVLLELEIQHQPSTSGVFPSSQRVGVELSREALDTMLDGLRKIRDQLSTVAGD